MQNANGFQYTRWHTPFALIWQHKMSGEQTATAFGSAAAVHMSAWWQEHEVCLPGPESTQPARVQVRGFPSAAVWQPTLSSQHAVPHTTAMNIWGIIRNMRQIFLLQACDKNAHIPPRMHTSHPSWALGSLSSSLQHTLNVASLPVAGLHTEPIELSQHSLVVALVSHRAA